MVLMERETSKTLAAVRLLMQLKEEGAGDRAQWNKRASLAVPGWSFINAAQWLTGAKIVKELEVIPEAMLSGNGFTLAQALAIVRAAPGVCETMSRAKEMNEVYDYLKKDVSNSDVDEQDELTKNRVSLLAAHFVQEAKTSGLGWGEVVKAFGVAAKSLALNERVNGVGSIVNYNRQAQEELIQNLLDFNGKN